MHLLCNATQHNWKLFNWNICCEYYSVVSWWEYCTYIVLKARNMVLDFRLLIEAGCAKVKYHHIPSNTLGHHLSIVPLISLLQMRCSTHISCEASLFWHFASFSGPEKKFWEMFPMIWWSTQNNEDSSMPLFHCFNDGWWCWCFHTWLKIIQHTDFFDTIMGWWQWQHLDYWRETFFWGCHRK